MKNLALVLSLFLLVLNSCKLIKYTNNIEFIQNDNELNFTYDLGGISIPTKVDTLQTWMLFDTGAGSDLITDSIITSKINEKDLLKFGKIKLPNGTKLKSGFYPIDIENSMFSKKNELVLIMALPKSECSNYSEKTSLSAIMGMNMLSKLKWKRLLFDFDNKKIVNPSDSLFKDLKQFMLPVKSKFFSSGKKHFKIFLKIDNEEIPLLFDTGNLAFPIILNSENNFENIPKTTYQGKLLNYVNKKGNISVNDFYENIPVSFGSKFPMNTNVLVTNSIKNNNVGLPFIKNYNWLIDYENEKVYVTKRKKRITEEFKNQVNNDYYVSVENGVLRIILKNTKAKKFSVNQEIIKVNGVKVTRENICDLMNEMNSKEFNWEKAIIKTKN